MIFVVTTLRFKILSISFYCHKMQAVLKTTIFLFAAFQLTLSMPEAFDYLQNIDPTIAIFPRYAQHINFVGEVIDGYKASTIIITKQAGMALSKVQKQLRQYGYSLLVYDAYRPQKAVDHFMRWSKEPGYSSMKQFFFPFIQKQDIIPSGYVAAKSGHTRGSTVDLTIIRLNTKIHDIIVYDSVLTDGVTIRYLDDGSEFMCSHFDFFGQPSHQDTELVFHDCLEKRNLLRRMMTNNGFKELFEEWWHYTLIQEPFPDTYFDFDII